jgi:hypothetical protein
MEVVALLFSGELNAFWLLRYLLCRICHLGAWRYVCVFKLSNDSVTRYALRVRIQKYVQLGWKQSE